MGTNDQYRRHAMTDDDRAYESDRMVDDAKDRAMERKGQQQTPKSRARRLIKNHLETPGHTLEELFVEIAGEIEAAEKRSAA